MGEDEIPRLNVLDLQVYEMMLEIKAKEVREILTSIFDPTDPDSSSSQTCHSHGGRIRRRWRTHPTHGL